MERSIPQEATIGDTCCNGSNHFVGFIATKSVRYADLDSTMTALEAEIEHFNVRGRTHEVPHPGFVTRFKFCPECGTALQALDVRWLRSGMA